MFFSVFLVFELRGVDADHHELIRILRLELFQIRNDVDAVDAAVGPEVQQYDFSLKGSQ